MNMEKMKMLIGSRIKELREKFKITQKELAIKIKVAQSAISQWESAINEPKASHILLLTNFFNVSADFLLGKIDKA